MRVRRAQGHRDRPDRRPRLCRAGRDDHLARHRPCAGHPRRRGFVRRRGAVPVRRHEDDLASADRRGGRGAVGLAGRFRRARARCRARGLVSFLAERRARRRTSVAARRRRADQAGERHRRLGPVRRARRDRTRRADRCHRARRVRRRRRRRAQSRRTAHLQRRPGPRRLVAGELHRHPADDAKPARQGGLRRFRHRGGARRLRRSRAADAGRRRAERDRHGARVPRGGTGVFRRHARVAKQTTTSSRAATPADANASASSSSRGGSVAPAAPSWRRSRR